MYIQHTHKRTHKSIVVSFFRGRFRFKCNQLHQYSSIYTQIYIYDIYVCNYRVLRKCIFRIICMYFCSLVNKKKMFWLYFCGIFRRTDFLIYQYQSKCLIKSNQASKLPTKIEYYDQIKYDDFNYKFLMCTCMNVCVLYDIDMYNQPIESDNPHTNICEYRIQVKHENYRIGY